jgi:hypothetical protein
VLREVEKDVQLFKIIIWNLQEFFDVVNAYRESYIKKESSYPKDRNPVLEVNRCMVNFLTSVTTYLQYLEKRIKHKYGIESENYGTFKRLTAKAFDDNQSYRFLYHLRHYAQHGGLPITELNFISEDQSKDSENVRHSFEVGISRDKLLQSNFNWNAQVRRDLENGPEDIDIYVHIEQFIDCLSEINSYFTQDEFVSLLKPATFISNLLEESSKNKGEPTILEVEISKDTSDTVLEAFPSKIHQFPRELVKAVLRGNLDEITSTIEIEIW